MAKKVFYDDDARKRVLGGAQILYNAVKTTMGPKGRNVVLSKSYGNPTVTHDGVTVAKGVDIADVDDETLGYKVGAELIKQAANKMNDVAGDGTTTVTVLTYHILNEANKLIAAGHNPMLLRKGLEAAAQDVLAQLGKLAEDIKGDKKRVAEVATISAGDPAIGALIAAVIEKVGGHRRRRPRPRAGERSGRGLYYGPRLCQPLHGDRHGAHGSRHRQASHCNYR